MSSARLRTLFAFGLTVAAGLATAAAWARAPSGATPGYDLIIRDGRVIDGTGNPWFRADVAVRGGRIVRVGRLGRASAARVIDAHNSVVSPGFIDMHTHSDVPLLVDGKAESKVRQGVTTEVLGESTSAGPIEGGSVGPTEEALAAYRVPLTWKTLGGYFAALQRQGTATNVASYVAAGQVRMSVIGAVNRPPTDAELERMKKLVVQAMRDGAFGLVTSLEAIAGYATTDEIAELAKVAGQYGGIYATHLRGESDELIDALNEAITIGEKARVPVDVFHLKASGEKNWGRIGEAIRTIETARARGLDITANQYPYIAGAHPLLPLLPPWALEGGVYKTMERLQDPAARARIKKEIEEGLPGWRHNYVQQSGGWKGVMISSTRTEKNHDLAGKTLADNARMRDKDPADAFMDLLLEEQGQVMGVLFLMSEEDVKTAMRQPWVSIGSDGSALAIDGPLGRGNPHPRNFGTFPRVLGRYVRDEHILRLEDAIRKMTSLSAQRLSITDRGTLRAGNWADIVVFDPDRIADRATYDAPKQYPVGIEYVIVNGKVVFDNGTHTGALPGQILHGPGYRSALRAAATGE